MHHNIKFLNIVQYCKILVPYPGILHPNTALKFGFGHSKRQKVNEMACCNIIANMFLGFQMSMKTGSLQDFSTSSLFIFSLLSLHLLRSFHPEFQCSGARKASWQHSENGWSYSWASDVCYYSLRSNAYHQEKVSFCFAYILDLLARMLLFQ